MTKARMNFKARYDGREDEQWAINRERPIRDNSSLNKTNDAKNMCPKCGGHLQKINQKAFLCNYCGVCEILKV